MLKLDTDIELLKKSVEHWERLAIGTSFKNEWIGTAACALCTVYFYIGCPDCPVKKVTGCSCCQGTPYEDIDSYVAEVFRVARNVLEVDYDKKVIEEKIKRDSKFQELALKEVFFLKNLLKDLRYERSVLRETKNLQN